MLDIAHADSRDNPNAVYIDQLLTLELVKGMTGAVTK